MDNINTLEMYDEYVKVFSLDSLINHWQKCKRTSADVPKEFLEDSTAIPILQTLHESIINFTYKPLPLIRFIKRERRKIREINAPMFIDRIVQSTLMEFLYQSIYIRFISTTYASIPSRGTHSAHTYLRNITLDNSEYQYAIKIDCHKYFDSINHEILKEYLSKYITNVYILNLLDLFLDSYYSQRYNLSYLGIPIGSYVSQMFANLYMHELDCYFKNYLNLVYIRYMDDILVLTKTYNDAKLYKDYITLNLFESNILLSNSKTSIIDLKQHKLNFLGYRTNGIYSYVLPDTCVAIYDRLRQNLVFQLYKIISKSIVQFSSAYGLNTNVTGSEFRFYKNIFPLYFIEVILNEIFNSYILTILKI